MDRENAQQSTQIATRFVTSLLPRARLFIWVPVEVRSEWQPFESCQRAHAKRLSSGPRRQWLFDTSREPATRVEVPENACRSA
jgi:hypothetical protein